MRADRHPREAARLDALREYGILDTPREADFDDLVALAGRICETPLALVSLVEVDRQWFKAAVGTELTETPFETSMCAHAILKGGIMEVPDLTLDPRFADNDLVQDDPYMRFYAGVPLETPSGLPLGTLCVLDTKPRHLTDLQRDALRVLGRQAMMQLELRRQARESELTRRELDQTLGRAEIGTWRYNVATGTVAGNPRAESFYNVTGSVPLETVRDAIHEDDRSRVAAAHAEAIRTGGHYEVEYRATGSDGNERWLLARGDAELDADGAAVYLRGVAIDITGRRHAEQALATSRSQLHDTLDLARVANWAWDAGSDRVQSNWLLRRFFGIPADEEGDLPLFEFLRAIHPEDRERVSAAIGASVESGEPYETEYRVTDAHGTESWVFARGHMIPGTTTLAGILVDVTARREAEAERETLFAQVGLERARLEQMFSESPAFIAVLYGPDLKFGFVNEPYYRLVGHRDVIGKPLGEAIPETLSQGFAEVLRNVMTTGQPWSRDEVPCQLQREPNGPLETRYLTLKYLPVHETDGSISGVYAHGIDITDGLQAREALRQSEERFRIVAQATRDAVWDWDLRSDSVWWNEGITEMFGHTDVEGTAAWWVEHIHPEDRERVVASIHRVIDEGHAHWQDEYRYLRGDGAPVIVEDRGFVVFDAEVRPIRMVGAMTDVTEQRMAQRRLEATVDERTAELREAVAEAERFNYSISHDLRTPLRAMNATAQVLIEEASADLTQEHRDLLERQAFNAHRLGQLIDQLLRLSRLGRIEMSVGPLDITEIAQAVADEIEVAGGDVCNIEIQPGMTAEGDPALIRLVYGNLLENACKFSKGQGTVRVRQEGGVFSVSDEGVGFDMKYAAKLFLPFERLVHEGDFPGTGIGLANVERIIRRHGGRIWAESEPGRGATFRFTLGG